MKCKRISLTSTVEKYEPGKGMEDGFEQWTKIVTQGWIVTDFLVKLPQDNGVIMCPYIKNRRGYTFIGEGDYIITDADGSRHVCGEDKIWHRYEKVED